MPKWGKSDEAEKHARMPVDGMKTYYDPASVRKDDDVVLVKMFNSYDLTIKDEGVSYTFNCTTQEFSSRIGEKGKWEQPIRILPGEQLYPFAKKLCLWD